MIYLAVYNSDNSHNGNAYFCIELIGNFIQMSVHTANNKLCGLCGKYDHNKNNDFMLPLKPLSLSEEYISTEGVELASEMNDDSWQRTNQFGDSWFHDAITTTSESVSFNFYLLSFSFLFCFY